MKKRVSKLLSGAIVSALAALMFASCWRQDRAYTADFEKFAPCPELPERDITQERSITQPKEMIEIQSRTYLASGITPRRKNPFLGINCYVGSSGRSNSSETNSFHDQNQLKPLLA